MIWYIIALILFLVAVGLMLFQYLRERRYLGSKTSQAMGDQLWQEIQDERESSKERKEKFRAALKQAEKEKKS